MPVTAGADNTAAMQALRMQRDPATQGVDPNEFESYRRDALYSPSNPEMAMANVFADRGIPGYNPIMKMMMDRSSQGLGASYTLQQAMSQNPAQNSASGFKDFLNALLSGQGGGVQGALSGGMSMLNNPMFRQALQGAYDMKRTGSPVTNPYLGSLLSLLWDPNALIGLQMRMGDPSLSEGYRNLGQLNALRGYRQMGSQDDFMKYILGGQ